MKWLIDLIVSLLVAFFPVFVESQKKTAEDSRTPTVLRDRLRAQVRAKWGTP